MGPFTRLLKKNPFSWDDLAEKSFMSLKNSICLTLFLIVPNLSKPFVLECDALGTSLWVILTQEGRICLSSPKQHKWVTKMLGYGYEIIYKKGKDNVVVDALSHQYED